jgi:hypothetical protein
VGIGKPDGGVRPIAIGEVIVKVATRILLCRHQKELAKLFSGLQYGIGTPGGAEYVFHSVADFVAASRPGDVVATLDATNAFNSPCRSRISKIVASLAPQFAGLFALEYAAPSSLFVARPGGEFDVILSESGTRQGSTGGALFFAVALMPALRNAHVAFRDKGVRIFAYLDDITITGPHQAVSDCAKMIEEDLKKLNISLNRKKCDWFDIHRCRGPPAGFSLCTDGIKLLGGLISLSREEKVKFVKGKMEKQKHFFRRLHLAPSHVATPILVASAVPRLGYYMRLFEAEVTLDAVKEFDDHINDIIFTKALEADPSDEIREIMHLSPKDGGCGVPIQQRLCELSHRASRRAYEHKRDHPTDTENTQRQLQKTAAEIVNGAIKAKLERNPDTARRLKECARKGTSGWITRPPASLKNERYCAALRRRTGAPGFFVPPHVSCQCCFSGPAQAWQEHVVSCARRTGPNVSSTHAEIKDAVKDALRDFGHMVETQEPRQFSLVRCPGCNTDCAEDAWRTHAANCQPVKDLGRNVNPHRSGPDVTSHPEIGAPNTIDVTTANSLCPSYAGTTWEKIVAARTKAKTDLYESRVKAAGHNFVVGVVSAHGHVAAPFAKFLKEQAQAAGVDPRPHLVNIANATVAATARTQVNAERQFRALFFPARNAQPAPATQTVDAPRPQAMPTQPSSNSTTAAAAGTSSLPPSAVHHHHVVDQLNHTNSLNVMENTVESGRAE